MPDTAAAFNPDDYYTAKEAAAILTRNSQQEVSIQRVHRLARRGYLPSINQHMPVSDKAAPRALRLLPKAAIDTCTLTDGPVHEAIQAAWQKQQENHTRWQSREWQAYVRGDI